jgi:hypothetical protein
MRSWRSFARHAYGDLELTSIVNVTVPEHAADVERFRTVIERVDVARYALMFRHGGIYADADHQLIAEAPLREAACSEQVVLPLERVLEQVGRGRYQQRFVVGQSLLVSPPRHPFWLALMHFLIARYDARCYEPMNTGPDALTAFVNGLCAQADSQSHVEGARARRLLRNVSIQRGFGDGRITRHHATGHWRTAQSRAHQRTHQRTCTLDYAALDLRRCAGLVRATYLRGFPPSPPEPSSPTLAAQIGAVVGGVAWCAAALAAYVCLGSVVRCVARRAWGG